MKEIIHSVFRVPHRVLQARYQALLVATLVLLTFFPLQAQQNATAVKYAQTITVKDLKTREYTLASKDFEGRKTATEGQRKAAAYIEEQFRSFGLQPIVPTDKGKSFQQQFPVYLSYGGKSKLAFGDYTVPADSLVTRGTLEIAEPTKQTFVYVPETFSYDSLEDLKDMMVMTPVGQNFRYQVATLQKMGVKGILFIVEDAQRFAQWKKYLDESTSSAKYSLQSPKESEENSLLMAIPASVARQLLRQNYTYIKRPQTFPFVVQHTIRVEEAQSSNVMGFLPGKNPDKKIIIVSGHYDHLGVKGDDIYYGADDDGSGTSSVLEMAQAFSDAAKAGHRPERSMLFLTVSGEEEGLLGSSYYTEHPIVPLEQTMTDLNIDMIGRMDTMHSKNPDFLYLVGADKISSELDSISIAVNKTYTGMDYDYFYNDENNPSRIYYRSDHWNFAKKGIPIIFYFSGLHEDYHQPTDTPDKIMYPELERRARLIFYTAWTLANRDKDLRIDKKED